MKNETAPTIAQVRKALENLRKWSAGEIKKTRAHYPPNVNIGLKNAAMIGLEMLGGKSPTAKFSGAIAKQIAQAGDTWADYALKFKKKKNEGPNTSRVVFETMGNTLGKLGYFPNVFMLEYGIYSEIPQASSSAYYQDGKYFGAESSKVSPERAARRRIVPAADPYERERLEKAAEELAKLEQAAEARAEGRLNRQWSRRY